MAAHPPVKLRWTPLADGHLKSAYEYLCAESPARAMETVDRILSAVETLRTYPHLGRKGRVAGTHELIITGSPFLVAYRVHGEQIEILAVLHGARRWPDQF